VACSGLLPAHRTEPLGSMPGSGGGGLLSPNLAASVDASLDSLCAGNDNPDAAELS